MITHLRLKAYGKINLALDIKKAVEAIHGSRQKQETLLDVVYLDQERLKSGVYEKMLYPME